MSTADWFLAGLQIVFSLDEVSFIQNLVFYIESAYCVPVSTTHKHLIAYLMMMT
jgi:hypothetical protein